MLIFIVCYTIASVVFNIAYTNLILFFYLGVPPLSLLLKSYKSLIKTPIIKQIQISNRGRAIRLYALSLLAVRHSRFLSSPLKDGAACATPCLTSHYSQRVPLLSLTQLFIYQNIHSLPNQQIPFDHQAIQNEPENY